MRIRWSALLVLTLVLMPRDGKSQGTQSVKSKKPIASAGPTYPNPFNPHAWTQFTIGDYPSCTESAGKRYRVTWKIYNLIPQLVKVPVLDGSSGGVAGGQKLENVLLPCGQYTAYWDGQYGNGKEAASGVYFWRFEVDGQLIKMVPSTVAK